MRKAFLLYSVVFVILLVSCDSSNGASDHSVLNNEVDNYEVTQTYAETAQGDFVFRLVSGREEYQEGESVQLYGEIEYVGEEPM
ncbi:hypothetical protein SAMN05216389_101211 [Oceanobacillus limi]|uniref:DUF3221 domain-containing protein n=1 Tax=Oceanobacillus limi TaxID=930131 RepID=A0A1H9Y5Q0_9BACI|nr:hypothetical protein [Oceanobacillus limi]SES64207.1 hypothetical protein SAMN05216389_101211 [Oceanobacillus limi]